MAAAHFLGGLGELRDHAGNLIANDHLDLWTTSSPGPVSGGSTSCSRPISTYSSNWPDATADTSPPGFGRNFFREQSRTNPAAIAAQVNYLQQILGT